MPLYLFADLPGEGRREAEDLFGPPPAGVPRALVPLHEREALWIRFLAGGDDPPANAVSAEPRAVTVAVGGVNAVSGEVLGPGEQAPQELRTEPTQNYLVCPPQWWLDGINVGPGRVRQFVAVRHGGGYTVEAQVTGQERRGGIQLAVFPPLPGSSASAALLPGGGVTASDGARTAQGVGIEDGSLLETRDEEEHLGLAAGGLMTQRVYPDPYGPHVWAGSPSHRLEVFPVLPERWRAWTGQEAPPTPVSAALYAAMGLPWFVLDDRGAGEVAAPEVLQDVASVADLDRARGLPREPLEEHAVNIDGEVVTLRPPGGGRQD
jgi:hypothetical protein